MFKELTCRLVGHQYYIMDVFSSSMRKVGCKRCRLMWGMHDGVQAFVQWDGDLAEAMQWIVNRPVE